MVGVRRQLITETASEDLSLSLESLDRRSYGREEIKRDNRGRKRRKIKDRCNSKGRRDENGKVWEEQREIREHKRFIKRKER